MSATVKIAPNPGYKRIATEEAFATPELLKMYRRLYESKTLDDPGFESLWGFYSSSMAPRPLFIRERLADVDAERIAHMDESGIDSQVLALTSPGVQVFDRDSAVKLAQGCDDVIATAVRQR